MNGKNGCQKSGVKEASHKNTLEHTILPPSNRAIPSLHSGLPFEETSTLRTPVLVFDVMLAPLANFKPLGLFLGACHLEPVLDQITGRFDCVPGHCAGSGQLLVGLALSGLRVVPDAARANPASLGQPPSRS